MKCLGTAFTALIFVSTGLVRAEITNVTSGGPLYLDLPSALGAANSGDHLLMSTGIYFVNTTVDRDISIEGGYDLAFLSQTNNPNLTELNGSNATVSIVTVNSNAVLTLDTLSLAHGSTLAAGGIWMVANNILTLRNSRVHHCFGFFGGGGVLVGTNSLLVCIDTDVDNNLGLMGGGIISLEHGSRVIMEGPNTRVRENLAAFGGGIACGFGELLIHRGAYIRQNRATAAGAGVSVVAGAGVLHGNTSGIGGMASMGQFNVVSNGNGGGLYLEDAMFTVAAGADIYSGYAGYGGGVWMGSNSTLIVDGGRIGLDTWVAGPNTASNGGCICMFDSHLVVSNQGRVQFGHAYNAGGGIYAERSLIEIVDDAVLGCAKTGYVNRAFNGAGIYAIGCTVRCARAAILGNQAINAGGAGVLLALTGAAHFVDTVINDNSASNTAGGLFVQLIHGNCRFERASLSNNTSAGMGGGLVYAGVPPLHVYDCAFVDNQAGNGGGMFVHTAPTVMLERTQLVHNRAAQHGGGMAARGALRLIDCLLVANAAAAGDGGALYTDRSTVYIATATNGCEIVGNTARNGGAIFAPRGLKLEVSGSPPLLLEIAFNHALSNGGFLYAANASTCSMYGSILVEGNTALRGGAVCLETNCHLRLNEMSDFAPLFALNSARAMGGALCLSGPGGNLGAWNSSFHGNSCTTDGGAVYLRMCNAELEGSHCGPSGRVYPPCILRDNLAGERGGAIFVDYHTMLRCKDALIVSNRAGSQGGAVYLSAATATFVNVVCAQNDATAGSGFGSYSGSRLALLHCTVADNEYHGIWNDRGAPNALYLTNCIVWGNYFQLYTNSATFLHSCDVQGGFPGGMLIMDEDPLFLDPDSWIYALHDGSPCIDTGVWAGVNHDCVGEPRPYGPAVDLGAYEFVPEPALTLLTVFAAAALVRTRRYGS